MRILYSIVFAVVKRFREHTKEKIFPVHETASIQTRERPTLAGEAFAIRLSHRL